MDLCIHSYLDIGHVLDLISAAPGCPPSTPCCPHLGVGPLWLSRSWRWSEKKRIGGAAGPGPSKTSDRAYGRVLHDVKHHC